MNNVLTQRIMEEMTETNPQEAIKYICYKALLIKERLGVEKQVNKVTEISRIVVNNVAKLSNLSFVLLLAFLVFEVWGNISSSSIPTLGKNFTGALLLIIALLVFLSALFGSYNVKKTNLGSRNMFKNKKKNVAGSLGENDLLKEIDQSNQNTTEVSQKIKKSRIALYMAIDKTNILNFLMFVVILISLVGYNQVFRGILWIRLSSIDTKKILKNRIVTNYPILAKS